VLAEGCVAILGAVFERGRVLDREVAAAFRSQSRWGKRDRHFVAESVWEVVRWRRALAFVAGSEDTAALLAAAWRRLGYEVPEWWRWDGEALESMARREGELGARPRAVRESVPDWLDRRGEEEMGEAWGLELEALNRRAPVFLRVNRLRSTVADAIEWLRGEGVEAEPVAGAPEALRLEGTLPKRLREDGRVEIQDAGSQQIVPLLEVEPGMTVIDACAGAGGKSLQIAAELGGGGGLVALDVSEGKLRELRRRARRAGVEGLEVGRWRRETLGAWCGRADRLLIDAPCSGIGTLRRQPDLKWRLEEPGVEKLRRTQRRLLDHHGAMLKAGGRMVYATCSLWPSENRRQVEDLLERDGGWEWLEEREVSPAASGWDGFYAAVLRKRG